MLQKWLRLFTKGKIATATSSTGHFIVASSVAWPLMGSKSAGDCFDNDLTVFVCRANQFVLMLISWHLIEKRSAPGLAFIGQVTEHTAVKWPHDYRAIEISSS